MRRSVVPGQESSGHAKCAGTAEEGGLFTAVTVEEQAAIRQFLNDPQVPGAEAGRAAALARAALKFAGMLLLAAGVVAGYADGNEFDEVGCSVALQPSGTSRGAHSAESRATGGNKEPGSGGGSAAGAGSGGSGGQPGCEVQDGPSRTRQECGPPSAVVSSVPKEAGQGAPFLSPEPDPRTRSLAARVFELLNALDPDNRLRRAPPIKVFLLRYRQNLSYGQIARSCGCARSLVALRLKAIQQKLPWRPQQLRELSAQVEAMQEALSDSRARRIYRKGAVHGDAGDENEE